MQVADQRYDILGTGFRVVSEDAAAADVVETLLRPFASGRAARGQNTFVVRVPDGERDFRLYRDCQYIYGAKERDSVVVALAAEVNRRAIDALETFAAHSAVVELDGRAIAFPAESGAGKTTLTTAAVMQGLGYVSDEALCVDPSTEEVVAYPRPLLLSPESRDLLGIDSVRAANAQEGAVVPSDLGPVVDGRLPLSHVVLPEFGHEAATLEPADSGEVMATLLRMSFNNYKSPEAAFRLTASIAGRVGGWRLRYGDPFEAVELLRDRLAR